MGNSGGSRRPIVVLGGTVEGREVAAELVALGFRVVSSVAGPMSKARLPDGEVRVGGFRGVDEMANWLRIEDAAVVVNATHPFAERTSAAAVAAAERAGVPHVRLERPGWRPGPGDRWLWADSLEHAAYLIGGLGVRVFVTTGQAGLQAFAQLSEQWFLIRCVDMPEPPLPPHALVLVDRGPYTVDRELALMRKHRIDLLVTRDSGGSANTAKLVAARWLGRPVIVVRRPPASPGVVVVGTPAEAVRWALTLLPR